MYLPLEDLPPSRLHILRGFLPTPTPSCLAVSPAVMECSPPQLHLGNILGAPVIGAIASAALFGVTSTQCFLYYQQSEGDSTLMKLVIGVLWILDAMHLASVTHAIYFYTVINFGNPVALGETVWSIAVQIFITNVSNAIVQIMFAQRVWILSRGNRPLVVFIVIMSLLAAAVGMGISIKSFQFNVFPDFQKFSWMMYFSNGVMVVADTTIAVSLCTLLHRSRTGFKKTDSMISVLMMYSINTGLLTSTFAVLVLITYAAMPNNLVYLGIYFVFSKLYFNSLLAALNAREGFKHGLHSDVLSVPTTSLHVTVGPSNFRSCSHRDEALSNIK